MKDRLDDYRRACLKAVEYQLGFQLPDGGYIWDENGKDNFHKQPYSWQLQGRYAETHKLLNWVKKNTLQSDGQLKDYNGDVYKHIWLFQGAHRLGRLDISYPVMSYLKSCQAPCGGFPHLAGHEVIRSMATNWIGIALLNFGDLAEAERIAQLSISMLEQQPRKDRFYFQMTRYGKLVTEKEFPDAQFIDTTKIKQCYWEVGFTMLLMEKLYNVTGKQSYLDYASRFFEFLLSCSNDNFSYWGSGKGALASALHYAATGDERARDAAYRFCDFVVDTQCPEGGFHYEDTPDELLYYIDHAACFSVWVMEIIGIMAGLEG